MKPPDPLTKEEILHLVLQPSSIPGLSYELGPNKNGFYFTPVKTNSYGMRDQEPLKNNPDLLLRIIVLGDSYTFGLGVFDDETYPSVLEKQLNDTEFGAESHHQYEVLNLGVPGYSTKDEALVLKHKGLLWDPGLVVIGYVLNDPEINPHFHPEFFYKPSLWQYSHFLRLLALGKRKLAIDIIGGGDAFRFYHAQNTQHWKSVLEAFDNIKNMTSSKGIKVLLLIFPLFNVDVYDLEGTWESYLYKDIHTQVSKAAQKNGFYVLDLFDIFKSSPDIKPSEVRVSETDPHPNKMGHFIVARAIMDYLLAHHQNLLKTNEQKQIERDNY